MENFLDTPIRKLLHDALRGPSAGMSLPNAKVGTTEKRFGGGAKSRLTNQDEHGSSNSKSNLDQIAHSVRHGIVLDALAKTPFMCRQMAEFMYGARISKECEEDLLNFGYMSVVTSNPITITLEDRDEYVKWAIGGHEQPSQRKNIFNEAIRKLTMVRFGLENYRAKQLTTELLHKPAQMSATLQMSKASYHRNGYAAMHNTLLEIYNEVDAILLTKIYDELAKRGEHEEVA